MHLRRLLLALIAATMILGSATASAKTQARPVLTWTRTVMHLDWQTASRVVAVQRHVYVIRHPKGAVTGTWTRTVQRSPHVRVKTTYPSYAKPQPTGQTVSLYITGYSWGCGTPNSTTADGSLPQVGDVSSDNPLYWHHRVYVPSLDYHGYVNDRGVGTGGMDLFAPDCATTYSYTGTRDVVIYP